MIFFSSDLMGHNIPVKDTFLARLVEYEGDGLKRKALVIYLNDIEGGGRDRRRPGFALGLRSRCFMGGTFTAAPEGILALPVVLGPLGCRCLRNSVKPHRLLWGLDPDRTLPGEAQRRAPTPPPDSLASLAPATFLSSPGFALNCPRPSVLSDL